MATTSRRRYNHVFSRFRIQLLILAVWLLRTLPAQSSAFQWHARLSPSRDGHTTRVAVRKTLRAEMLPHLSIRRALQQQVDVSPTVAENQSVELLPGNANALQPQVSPPQNDAERILALSDVTRKVTSAEQLSQAILDGAVHILITSHMDLHMLPATRPLVVSGTTSIRGSCPGEPSSTLEGAAALPQRTTPTQCVLRVPAGLLSAASAERGSVETPRLWLDNLFLTTATGPEPPSSASNRTALRVQQRSSDAADGAVQLTIGSRSEAWLTNIVLEVGHGHGPAARGIDVQSAASLYTRNITIASAAVGGPPLIVAMPGATLLLNQTALVNGGEGVALRVLTAPPPPAGVRRPLAAEPSDASRVWLEGVNWDTAAPAALTVDARGGGDVLLFSDSGDEVVDTATGEAAAAQPLPEDELAAGFVSEASPWFQGAKQEALDATGVPYFLASGAQERPSAPAVQAEPGRVRVVHTPTSSAIVLVPCIVAAVLFAAVALALAVQYARTHSCRRRSLPSTMGKSMSGTDRSVHSGAAAGHSRKGSGDGGRGVSAHVSAAGSDDGEIAAGQGRGAAPAATPRLRTAYSLVSVPEPHSLRAGGGEDLEAARSAPLAPPDVTEGSLNQALHECASSPGNSGRGSLSFSYSQFPDSPTSAVSHLSHTSWPAGPRTLWDASQPLSHSLRLFTPAHLLGAASPAPIGRAAAAGDTPTGGAQAAVAVAPQPTAGVAAVAAVPGAGAAPADHTAAQEGPAAAAGGAYGAAPRSGGSTAVREDISTFSIGLPGPPSRHAPDERDQALTATLDAMHSAGDALGELFEVMSAEDRRYGRHGVVQPVRRAADGAAMAAKFYRERSVFEAELRARSMLPRSVVLATKLVDHSTIGSGSDSDSDNSGSVAGWSPPAGGVGAGLPPHIVMDRGTPLADWVAARGPAAGFVERVRIVEEVAGRLATMHAAGWTHGALKPGNVLWREIGGEWLLTDVCDAALIGKRGAVSCVPPLSPPEAATAVREQQEVPAAAAADLWALGVIACQLLAPATAVHAAMQPDSAAAWDAACGRAPFPWEPAAPERPACVAELRGAAAAVLGCVSREPGDRPTAARLAAALRDVLAEHEQPAPSV